MRIFVEKLPDSCSVCDCCHTKPYDNRRKIDGKKFCGIMDIDVNVYYYDYNDETYCRPNWCPLKEIPKEETGADIHDEYDTGYQHGWNAFRREILGE